MTAQRFPRVLGLVAAAYLLAMAVVFALLSAQSSAFAREAVHTSGTVVALVARAPLGSTRDSRTNAGTPSLAPRVSYTVAGQSYEYTAAHGRYHQRLRVGDTVTVLYAPGDPRAARLQGEGRALGPVITVGFGLAAAAVVLALVRAHRRPARLPAPSARTRQTAA